MNIFYFLSQSEYVYRYYFFLTSQSDTVKWPFRSSYKEN